MNILIKDNTMPLVKKLSEVYKCSNEAAARALQTKTARKIVLKQLGFAAICLSEEWHKQVSPQDSHLMKKSNSDLNFTYEKNGETLLMVASKCVVNGRARQGLFEWLIKNGADITVADRCGSTVPYMALDASSYHEDQQLIEYLWDHPYFNINDIRWYGYKKTLLMHIVLLLHSSNQDFDQYELRGERSVLLPLLHKLLAKGADPELGGISDSGDFVLTPLSLAEQFKDQEVINIIRDAIVRKHAQKHTQ